MSIQNEINNTFPLTTGLPMYLAGPISLSTTDISNLATVGKLLIASPGSGFANIPFQAWCESSTGTAWGGSSSANFVNGSNTNITASTLFLGLNGSTLLNSSSVSIAGAATSTYTILNNQGTYLLAPSITSGGNQTCKVWIRYLILPLV